MPVAALLAALCASCWVLAQSAPATPATSNPAPPATTPAQPAPPAAPAPAPAKPPAAKPPAAAAAADAASPPATLELVVVGKKDGKNPEDFKFRLGETLVISASGSLAKAIAAEFAKPSSQPRMLTLYLDGVRMTGLPTRPFDISDKSAKFGFDLARDAGSDENRKAWDALFKSNDNYEMTIDASVGIANDSPRSVHSAQPLKFSVANPDWIYAVFSVSVGLFLLLYLVLVTKTRMLLDADTGFYSLGKSQMAFWGLLVLLSFFGVWILTGTMERISPQALVLLGISGATGLTAIFIGTDSKLKLDQKILEIQAKLPQLATQESALTPPKHHAPLTAAKHAQLLSIKSEIATLTRQLHALVPQGFWYDIVNDGNGPSFHRAQVVGWTIVLGMVFIGGVMQVMSMPEFPQTLLVLMGISNATYLGFKIPEKAAP